MGRAREGYMLEIYKAFPAVKHMVVQVDFPFLNFQDTQTNLEYNIQALYKKVKGLSAPGEQSLESLRVTAIKSMDLLLD
jgi:hypothetical protein